jgi:hypothetical protein
MKLRVLVGCEYSGVVRNAFRKFGHDAFSCDLLPSDDNSPYHIQGDVLEVLAREDFDLGIFHPPCTYMCNSGVSWLYKGVDENGNRIKNEPRWQKLRESTEFFIRLWGCNIPHVAIENPIMHGTAKAMLSGLEPSVIVQPWMFGHKEKKATCLWLKNLPLLQPTTDLKEETDALPKKVQQRLHYLPPSKDRWKLRSTTYQGIADAMATQWIPFVSAQVERRRACSK